MSDDTARTDARSDDATDEATRTVEARDAHADHDAGRGPTEHEEALAEANEPVSPDVAQAYEAALERGANVEGEGKIV